MWSQPAPLPISLGPTKVKAALAEHDRDIETLDDAITIVVPNYDLSTGRHGAKAQGLLQLTAFMPQIPTKADTSWLPVAVSPDPSDPKLAHLDGLNLSRAWMLEGILSDLPADDPRRPALSATAAAHKTAGLAAVTGRYYEVGHWLGSFAVYLTTRRGIRDGKREQD